MAAMDLLRFTLMWLLVFCHLFLCVECEEKNDLTVYKGNVEVTDQVFLNGSNDCLTSFNETNLPSEVRGVSVDRPGDMQVSLQDTEHSLRGKHIVMSGIRLSWSSPRSGVSREHLKGFFVLIRGEKETTDDRCRLYLVDQSAFLKDELDFRLEMKYFAHAEENFEITAYSLPPEPPMGESGAYRRVFVKAKTPAFTTFPGLWVPTIAYVPSLDRGNGSLKVSFSFPPQRQGWNLKEFKVQLVKCSNDVHNHYLQENIIKDEDSAETEGHVQFQGLDQDLYSVVVGAHNYEFPNQTLCVCQKKAGSCNPSCNSAQTVWFDLLGNKHPTPSSRLGCLPPTPTPKSTAEPPILSTQEPTTEINQTSEAKSPEGSPHSSTTPNLGILFGITVPLVVILIAGILAAYFCWWRRRDTGGAKDIVRKIIYIMSTADHPASVRVLNVFCDLLEKCCQCDVINPRNADLTQISESVWVTAKMSRSECLMFVSFKGMDALLDAFLADQTVPLDPNHSLLHKALQIAFNTNDTRQRSLISISFTQDWTSDKLALLRPQKFLLPKELISLFAGVHNIGERSAENWMRKVLNVDHVENLPEYQALKEAVKELSRFESNNQDWFDDNYNIIDTTASTTYASISSSISSGHSSTIHGTLSVSLTDISPDADSPVSVFGQPSFSQAPVSPDDGIGLDESNLFSSSSVPGFHNALSDGYSVVTFGQESDIQHSDTETNDQADTPCPQPIAPRTLSDVEYDNVSTALRKTNDDSQTSTHSVSDKSRRENPKSTQAIIPPIYNNIGLSAEDSISTRIADLNDSSSIWSKPSNLGTSCHIEDEKKGLEQRPTVITPPRLSIPMDNSSAMLEVCNDQDSAVCFRTVDASAHEKDEFYDSGLPEMTM